MCRATRPEEKPPQSPFVGFQNPIPGGVGKQLCSNRVPLYLPWDKSIHNQGTRVFLERGKQNWSPVPWTDFTPGKNPSLRSPSLLQNLGLRCAPKTAEMNQIKNQKPQAVSETQVTVSFLSFSVRTVQTISSTESNLKIKVVRLTKWTHFGRARDEPTPHFPQALRIF